jgi:ribonuclease HI
MDRCDRIPAVTIIAAADGSALGNPGPAGWAWYVDDDCWAAGGWAHGTNNMGELTGVLDLLQQTAHLDEDLLIYCDSTYVINSVTKWMVGWKRRGWKKGDGKPVLNVEIMKAIDAAMQGRRVRFEWVKGHTGHELNEAADRLANAAALSWREGKAPDPGPGFAGAGVAHPDARPGQVVEEPDLFSFAEPEPEPVAEPVADVVEVRRTGGLVGRTVTGTVDLAGTDSLTDEVRRLVVRIDLRRARGGDPRPDMFVYSFRIRGVEVSVPEQHLTDDLRELAGLVLSADR